MISISWLKTVLRLFVLWCFFSVPTLAADPSPEALMEAGHWKRVRPLAEQQYKQNPEDARSAYLLARVKDGFGDVEGALPLAEKAVKLDPNNSAFHFLLAQVCGETAEKASFFSKASWAHRFKEEADKAAALDPRNFGARFALVEYYLEAPRLMGGGKEKARAMADEIAKIDTAEGYLAQARLAQEEKDSAKEEAAYLKAVETAPRNLEVLVSLANFYAAPARKKLAPAEKYARSAVEVDPSRIDGYRELAAVLAFESKWSELDALLAQAEKTVSDDLNPYYRAGLALLLDNRELARAERYFRKYLTQEPEANTPRLSQAHWRLGEVLEKQGRKPEAITELRAAIQLEPGLQQAKADLKRLQ